MTRAVVNAANDSSRPISSAALQHKPRGSKTDTWRLHRGYHSHEQPDAATSSSDVSQMAHDLSKCSFIMQSQNREKSVLLQFQ